MTPSVVCLLRSNSTTVPLDMALTWTGSASSAVSLSFFLNMIVFATAGAGGARKALAAWRRAARAMWRRMFIARAVVMCCFTDPLGLRIAD